MEHLIADLEVTSLPALPGPVRASYTCTTATSLGSSTAAEAGSQATSIAGNTAFRPAFANREQTPRKDHAALSRPRQTPASPRLPPRHPWRRRESRTTTTASASPHRSAHLGCAPVRRLSVGVAPERRRDGAGLRAETTRSPDGGSGVTAR